MKFPYLKLSFATMAAVLLLLSCGDKNDNNNTDNPPVNPAPAPGPGDFTEQAAGVPLEMVYLNEGVFRMGAGAEQNGQNSEDELPVHSVKLSGFYISRYEITQSQFEAVMGYNPSYIKDTSGEGLPVEGVSWYKAMEFCDSLSMRTGKKYTLPTEAQWEFAARGGTKSQGHQYSGGMFAKVLGWCFENSYHPHPVGLKGANEAGLYDMSGNVWEWCSDWYDESYYKNSPIENPQGPESGTRKSIRGGAYNTVYTNLRVSNRYADLPSYSGNNQGFRVVLNL